MSNINFFGFKKSINQLCNQYNADKGTDPDRTKWGEHAGAPALGYAPTYDKLFGPLRNKQIEMLEIGIADGRFPGVSLMVWDDYFENLGTKIIGYDLFPHATVSESYVRNLLNNRPRVDIIKGDQGSPEQLNHHFDEEQFDIIIDDGSHFPEHIEISLGNLFDKVKSGGLYIIEDLCATKDYHPFGYDNFKLFSILENKEFDKLELLPEEQINFLKENIDTLEAIRVFDDLYAMIVIRKK